MQVSADYYGMRGLREVEGLNAKGEHLAMNVSAEADSAFMRELQQEDPERYARLVENVGAVAQHKSRRVVRHYKNCLGCGKKFLAKRANNTTCSPKCQRKAHRKARMSEIPANTLLEAA